MLRTSQAIARTVLDALYIAPSIRQTCLPPILNTLPRRLSSSVPEGGSEASDDELIPAPPPLRPVNTSYRTPTETLWPATKHQEKFAGRVHRALTAVLAKDATFRDELIEELGVTIKDIRVSPDHAKAFILWDSYNGRAAAAAGALRRSTPRLRAMVARAMAAKNVPRLEFRHDRATAEQAELDRIFQRLSEEDR